MKTKNPFTLIIIIVSIFSFVTCSNDLSFDLFGGDGTYVASFTSVFFIDAYTGWVVGSDGIILNTKNGGKRWDNRNVGKYRSLESVCFVNATTGWAVGNNGTILNTIDGGKNWIDQGWGMANWLSVCFVNDTTGWVVGCDHGYLGNGNYATILMTSNGGLNWIEQWKREVNDWDFVFNAVHFIDENTGVKAGSKALLFELQGLDNFRVGSYNGGIGMKYFRKNNSAIRGGLQFSYSSETFKANPPTNYNGKDGCSTSTIYGIESAFEYHLSTTKINPYIDGGLSISTQSYEMKSQKIWPKSSTSHINRQVQEFGSGLDFSFLGWLEQKYLLLKK